VPAYRALGGLGFAYGQGSAFAGFTAGASLAARDTEIDIVLVWDRDAPPEPSVRPVDALSTGPGLPATLHQPGFVVDRFRLDGARVGVTHRTRKVFEGWLRDVRSGRGWESAAYPLPLYAVSGFAYGALLDDETSAGSDIRTELSLFPPALVERSRSVLLDELPGYDRDLMTCARRGDGWLFHELFGKVMRHALVAWFAAERRYCPHPEWLHQWVARFGMDPGIAGLERGLWAPPVSLGRRRELFAAMTERILALPGPRSAAGGYAAGRPR
jgi:hypothetical protein